MTGEDAIEQKKKKGIEDTSKLGQATETANKIVGDAVFGIRTVASFNLEQQFYEGYAKSSGTVAATQKGDACKSGFFLGLGSLVMMGSMGTVFFLSVHWANQGIVGFTEAMLPMFVLMGGMRGSQAL